MLSDTWNELELLRPNLPEWLGKVTVTAFQEGDAICVVVSDDEGLYRIVDLRPGTYTVTFTLAGFSTVRQTEIIVPANVSVPINAPPPELAAYEPMFSAYGMGWFIRDLRGEKMIDHSGGVDGPDGRGQI